MFKELPTKLDFPALERDILHYWEENGIFKRTIEERDPANSFIFYEGPPTANGRPGIHHVIGRTIKDLVCRLKTMQGYRVERKGGWDTHGLPVEIEVEKELGFSTKEDIEEYGVAKFNEKCKQSVWKYKTEWDELTRRIGFWLDLDNPYVTYENDYMESVWWILSEFWKKDLIYQGHKILPYCPRCETPLSSHEVSQGYREVEDPSVYVRMRLVGEERTSFLVWTTTPWTLISNVALALHPEIDYAKIKLGDEFLILAKARLSIFDEPYDVVSECSGKQLLGRDYEPLFNFCQSDQRFHFTVAGDFVSTEEGTGIVHIAPAFGEDDHKLGLKFDLPVFQPVDKSGKFTEEVTLFKGKSVKEADPEIIENLRGRGLLFKAESHLHSYPHCWRCSSPLLYYAKKSWFVRTTAMKDRLIHHNREVDWYPREVGEGRFGEWLENNVDWSLSRDRYWGTPLPIWLCSECGHGHCVGGVAELRRLSGLEEEIDLHKPYIDEVYFPCSQCQGNMQRVPEVIDCWFDSGSMPVAQWHYPFENQDIFERSFPADFISEGVDQTRGWFYSLLAIAAIQFDQPCYKACISNDLILDKFGQKMSKSKGNTVDPTTILSEFGADALRWYLLTVSPPWVPTRFDEDGVREVLRKLFGTLVNVYSFFTTYANIDDFSSDQPTVPVENRSDIDRWLLSRQNRLVAAVEDYLFRYDLTKSARMIADFVIDDLSNWYVRRCRRRFWKSEMGSDKLAAYQTLQEVLCTTAKLMAPFTPFISEEIFRNLASEMGENQTDSVHLATYPNSSQPEYSYRATVLEENMDLVRQVVFLGRSLRNESGIKVRQPLPRIIVVAEDPAKERRVDGMASLIMEELNVKTIDFVPSADDLTTRKALPKFSQLGPKFGKRANKVAEIIRNLADHEIQIIQQTGGYSFDLDGTKASIESVDVEVVSESADGLVLQNDGTLTVALDTTLTDALRNEGLAREFVNRVQNMRKNAGFDVEDRIRVSYEASEAVSSAIESQSAYIRNETLAQELVANSGREGHWEEWTINGTSTVIGIKKIAN